MSRANNHPERECSRPSKSTQACFNRRAIVVSNSTGSKRRRLIFFCFKWIRHDHRVTFETGLSISPLETPFEVCAEEKWCIYGPSLNLYTLNCMVQKELFRVATCGVHAHRAAKRKLPRAINSRLQMSLYHISHRLKKQGKERKYKT